MLLHEARAEDGGRITREYSLKSVRGALVSQLAYGFKLINSKHDEAPRGPSRARNTSVFYAPPGPPHEACTVPTFTRQLVSASDLQLASTEPLQVVLGLEALDGDLEHLDGLDRVVAHGLDLGDW